MYQGLIHRYRDYLPVSKETPVITLHEGNTPLIPLHFSDPQMRDLNIYAKFEGANPTGSFKDRGMTMAITKAVEEGAKAVICASTGNTSASAAAYAARAGLRCLVVLPKGKIAMGKLSQALVHGARVIAIEGNFDLALKLVRALADEGEVTLVNSVNPYRIEGQKTAAFEIVDDLGDAPDYLAIPVGNAGNITAYWRGFGEYTTAHKASKAPVMLGFQAAGAAPIVENRIIDYPETVATAIRIGNPASWQGAVNARDASGGRIDAVTDAEILAAYRVLARETGVFCEPASAASVAGVMKLASTGFFAPGSRIVCVLTGHGLKDPDQAVAAGSQSITIRADLAELGQELHRD